MNCPQQALDNGQDLGSTFANPKSVKIMRKTA